MHIRLSLPFLTAALSVALINTAMAINIPEPASMGLIAVGIGVLAADRVRRRK
jgi:hypothetical protein